VKQSHYQTRFARLRFACGLEDLKIGPARWLFYCNGRRKPGYGSETPGN
jgi:hypothetical protein